MPWYILVPSCLVALVAVLWVAGTMIARDHTATSTIELKASPAQVWSALTDWRHFKDWRKELQSVDELVSSDGKSGWVEVSAWGRMPLVVERNEPERLFVGRIAADDLPFGGTWTHRLELLPGGGTRLSSTENGHIKPPLFRLMAACLFGYHKTLNDYQRALAGKFGEPAAPTNS